jgi:glycosyltransferase involved in cell wall biosynthesis
MLNTRNPENNVGLKRPKISVVIPCHNSEKIVPDAINSVLKQSERDFELIMVDDGSTDGTAAVIESINDPRVKLVRQENKGASAARNTGINAARGDYVAFLDHDDLWLPTFLEKTVTLLDRDPQAIMVAANQYWQKHPSDHDTTLYDCVKFDNSRNEILFEDLIRRNIISTSASVVRREALIQCGGFDEELRVAEDYNLWLKISTMRRRILVVAEPLGVSRRFVVGSLVKNKLLMAHDGLLCLDKFYKSHGHLLSRAERKAFKKMRRNTWLGLLYRALRQKFAGKRYIKQREY